MRYCVKTDFHVGDSGQYIGTLLSLWLAVASSTSSRTTISIGLCSLLDFRNGEAVDLTNGHRWLTQGI